MPCHNPDDIDAILPQTQCGLCGYGGCLPYAEALVYDNAAINLCPPGGASVLNTLGDLMDINPEPYMPEMLRKQKTPAIAIIREQECIGCTKCITACPVDAILGSGKSMHTVITEECTSCELCIPACPVDCIEMVTLNSENFTFDKQKAKIRHQAKLLREKMNVNNNLQKNTLHKKRNYIEAALARAKLKKSNAI